MPEASLNADWNHLIVPELEAADIKLGEKFLAETIAAYSGKDRHYHNLLHIVDCHQKLEPYEDREDYSRLWLALLWHDEIYKTRPERGTMSNEKESARLAYGRMEQLNLRGTYQVARLIVGTERHDSNREDEILVNDIDMSILAEPSEIYMAYSDGIRREYDWVPPDIYREARINILRKFARPIFKHQDFEHLNPMAEENIQDEIQLLGNA